MSGPNKESCGSCGPSAPRFMATDESLVNVLLNSSLTASQGGMNKIELLDLSRKLVLDLNRQQLVRLLSLHISTPGETEYESVLCKSHATTTLVKNNRRKRSSSVPNTRTEGVRSNRNSHCKAGARPPHLRSRADWPWG